MHIFLAILGVDTLNTCIVQGSTIYLKMLYVRQKQLSQGESSGFLLLFRNFYLNYN